MSLADQLAHLEAIPVLEGHVALGQSVRDILSSEPPHVPYAWLVEPRGRSNPSRYENATWQQHEQIFGVLTVVTGDEGDESGASALANSEQLRGVGVAQPSPDTVLGALMGRCPTPGFGAIEHIRDGRVQWADNRLYWLDEFIYRYTIRSPR